MRKILSAAMLLLSSTCFAHNANQEAWDDELLTSILANENECVLHYEDQKIYLNPDKIHPTSQGVYLNLNENEFIFVPILNSDNQGCYVECVNWNFDPRNTCPGCGKKFYTGGCRNQSCPEYQRQQGAKENHKREQQQKKDDYKKHKKKKH